MKKKIVKWILVIFWMCIIFYFSSIDSNKSTDQSRSVVNKTNIVEIYKEKANVDSEKATSKIDKIFRKIAHGIEYFILVILVCSLVMLFGFCLKDEVTVTATSSDASKVSDDVAQNSMPIIIDNLRSGEIRDIIIDNIGNGIGLLSYYLFKRRKI